MFKKWKSEKRSRKRVKTYKKYSKRFPSGKKPLSKRFYSK